LNNSHFSVAKIFLQTLWKIPDDKVDYFLHKSKLNFKNLFLQSSLLEIFKEIQGEKFHLERFDIATINSDKKMKRLPARDFI